MMLHQSQSGMMVDQEVTMTSPATDLLELLLSILQLAVLEQDHMGNHRKPTLFLYLEQAQMIHFKNLLDTVEFIRILVQVQL